MNRAQRWVVACGVMKTIELLVLPPSGFTVPSSIRWGGAALFAICLLLPLRVRGHVALTEPQRRALRWWRIMCALNCPLFVAMALGVVPPLWVSTIAFFPLVAAFFVTAGGMTGRQAAWFATVMQLWVFFEVMVDVQRLGFGAGTLGKHLH